MRIIAGRWRGRVIRAPQDERVRPTGDRPREAWLMIVHGALPGARVLDLCAGSGALGLEALSRGAAYVDFVDIGQVSLRALRANIATLGADGQARVHRADALRFVQPLAAGAYDIAFADPPWDGPLAEALARAWLVTPFAGCLGIEHRTGVPLPGGDDTRAWGETSVTFFRSPDAPP